MHKLLVAIILPLCSVTACSTIDARSKNGATPFAGTRQFWGSTNSDYTITGLPVFFDMAGSFGADFLLLPYDLTFGRNSKSEEPK